tara:strand:+ start:239 stop:400 length:162 start_codon:yes stop_codon:yes gene_type:complete
VITLNVNREREKRSARTGKWFQGGIKAKTNIWLEICLPLLLIVILVINSYFSL